jgi:hypothetical protein
VETPVINAAAARRPASRSRRCSNSSDSAASGRAKRCVSTAPLPRSRSLPLRSWSSSETSASKRRSTRSLACLGASVLVSATVSHRASSGAGTPRCCHTTSGIPVRLADDRKQRALPRVLDWHSGLPTRRRQPFGPSPRRRGAGALADLTGGVRDFGRRRRALITVVDSLATAALLAFLLAGRRHEFAAALSGRGVGARGDRAAAGRRAARAQRGVASDHPGGRRDGRPPRPLSRVDPPGTGQRDQRAAGSRRGSLRYDARRQSSGRRCRH